MDMFMLYAVVCASTIIDTGLNMLHWPHQLYIT